MRLLRQKVPIEDWQIEDLKVEMFQLDGGVWFSREMISDDESLREFRGQATKWLMEHGCFSVERLFEGMFGVVRHILTPEHFATFLRHLGFTVTVCGKCGLICFQPPSSPGDCLAATAKKIAAQLHDADGMLVLYEIEESLSHLTPEAVESIRTQFLPEVHKTEIGGVPCWQSAEAIPLPEDFAEKLTYAVDALVDLEESVTAVKLEFALNLFYRIRFRKEYALPDNSTFMRVCAKHYQGEHAVFASTKKPGDNTGALSVMGKRVRSPNTRFLNLGVPIGSELTFTRNKHITCTVHDDSNQVQYNGKVWAISALANHLLGASAANGFYHFSFRGETLWGRRLRLEREGKQDEYQTAEMPPAEGSQTETDIIGLGGQPISPATWRAFRSAGTNPRVTEWAERVRNGDSVENIARDSGYAVSTVEMQIVNQRRYFKVCEINKIMPDGGVNV